MITFNFGTLNRTQHNLPSLHGLTKVNHKNFGSHTHLKLNLM